MIVEFKEKESKKYEVQDNHVDEIFEIIKEVLVDVLEVFKDNDRDLLIALMSINSISGELNQDISTRLGADKIIEITGARELN